MSTTRRHTATLVATLLAGTLALGACGAETAPDEPSPSVPQEQAARGQAAPAAADRSEDSRKAHARYKMLSLTQLRAVYPTAGTEVPPASLHARTRTEKLATYAEKLTANNLHTGMPRVNAHAPDDKAVDPHLNRAE